MNRGAVMALKEDIETKVRDILLESDTTRKGRVVPAPDSIQFGDDVLEFDQATVLYADLKGSTKLVDSQPWWFAKEIYKAYLYSVGRIIRSQGGEITAYDGDRIMGVYLGNTQCADAARTALKINHAVAEVLNPAFENKYAKNYSIEHVVGIDRSPLRVARTGVRDDSDLVWIGRAANYAAKLTELNDGPSIWVTGEVFDNLTEDTWYGGSQKQIMWREWNWTPMNKMKIYSSTWQWSI